MGCCSSKKNVAGTYDPSCFTLCMATSNKSDYKNQHPAERYTGTKPILVVATDEGLMEMSNRKVFNTGNHPLEMLVPMLHFRDAGFTFDIATAHGNPVVLEMWAYPPDDENVHAMHDEVRDMMEKPKTLEDILDLDAYSAIFIPGGHGCMINLPSSVALGKLLNIAHERSLPTVTLCHGPSVFLSTNLEGTGKTECAYKGYKVSRGRDAATTSRTARAILTPFPATTPPSRSSAHSCLTHVTLTPRHRVCAYSPPPHNSRCALRIRQTLSPRP